MYTDTHSWKCHCDKPDTTQKYFINHTERNPLHLESTVFEHGYMVPNKVKKAWSKSSQKEYESLKGKEVDIANRYSYTTPRKEGQKSQLATRESNDKKAEKPPREYRHKKKKHIVLIDLSSGPITARKPFRVSSAHWASCNHTQQWPWKGTLQCQLVTQSGNRHSTWSRHTHCWTHKK